MVDTFETLLYRQKQALHSWESSIGAAAKSVTPEIENSVWELLVFCADNLTEPSTDIDEEIARIAYDLATMVLQYSDVRSLHRDFRDALIDAVLQHAPATEFSPRRLIHFANLLSDAYWVAYSDRLRRTISHQRTSRLSEELHMAKRIQERLLPKHVPEIPGFQIAGRVIPATEVGGDYWSVKRYEDDGIVTLKLADISGHGIAAATLVAAVKFITGGYYRAAASAHEVVERTNKTLVRETPVEILVTMVYTRLHPDSRQLDIVNAGHEPVFICSGDKCTDIRPTGPVLGVTETEYTEQQFHLNTGDIFFVCSDGIMEAGTGEPFGPARIKEIVINNRERTAEEIADAVINAVTEYAGQPHDDMSLVVLKTLDEPTS